MKRLFTRQIHSCLHLGLVNLLLSDSAHPRVQAHAAAAMVNFCEDCPPKIIEPYLDSLVDALENVLSSKLEEVRILW